MAIRGAGANKKQVRVEAGEVRDRKYQKARKELRKRLDGGGRPSDFYPALSGPTVKRIYDGDPGVGIIQMDRLIDLLEGGISSSAYNAIATSIGQTRSDTKVIADKLCGDYRYFRYDDPISEVDGQLAEGRIRIFVETNGDIACSHWPPESEDDAPPEHSGYAFLVDSKLFMLSWKPKVMRLGIAHYTEDGNGVMSGYVLAVRTGGSHQIFAASSVLIHESNTQLIEGLRCDGAIKLFQRHHIKQDVSYLGG